MIYYLLLDRKERYPSCEDEDLPPRNDLGEDAGSITFFTVYARATRQKFNFFWFRPTQEARGLPDADASWPLSSREEEPGGPQRHRPGVSHPASQGPGY